MIINVKHYKALQIFMFHGLRSSRLMKLLMVASDGSIAARAADSDILVGIWAESSHLLSEKSANYVVKYRHQVVSSSHHVRQTGINRISTPSCRHCTAGTQNSFREYFYSKRGLFPLFIITRRVMISFVIISLYKRTSLITRSIIELITMN